MKAKVLNETHRNCTPTYLHQCCSLSHAVHHTHTLLQQRHVAPSRVRQLAPEVRRELEAMGRRAGQQRPYRLAAQLGQGIVFALETEAAIQAVDYVDGDGG